MLNVEYRTSNQFLIAIDYGKIKGYNLWYVIFMVYMLLYYFNYVKKWRLNLSMPNSWLNTCDFVKKLAMPNGIKYRCNFHRTVLLTNYQSLLHKSYYLVTGTSS